MKNIFYSLIVVLFFSLAGFVGGASAQSRLTYPVPDLGYCRDAKECYLYCEIPQNKAACWSYGKYKVGSDVLGVTTMSADEKRQMQEKARQYNITFPIAELGNCAGPQECRDFCEQPANQTICMAFAKKKGFDKEMERSDGMDPGKRDELLQRAKTELGCTSMESCSRVCESDQSRCEAFAKKHGVYQEPSDSSGRYSAEEKRELMQKAQTELGCISMESCKSICEKNPQQCMDFAKKHGFDKGEEQRREQNDTGSFRPPEAVSTTQMMNKESTQRPIVPGECRTEAECKNWCDDHPDKCPNFSEGKQREEQSKREYELRKKEMENQQETQKRQFETNQYRPPTTSSGDSGSGSGYQTTQPSSGSYTPPATQQATP